MGMRVVHDGIWLCVDCTMVAVNGDASGLDYSYGAEEAAAKLARIEQGLNKLGPHLVSAEGHEEFSAHGCDCCGSHLAGELHEFAVLGPEPRRFSRVPTVFARARSYTEAIRPHVRQPDATLERFTSLGCYPIFYLVESGRALSVECPECAENTFEHGDQDRVTAADVNWEDPSLFCEDCGKRIESAYAEEDADI